MQSTEYTLEQKKDIEERVAKVQAMLKELNLRPSSVINAVNTG